MIADKVDLLGEEENLLVKPARHPRQRVDRLLVVAPDNRCAPQKPRTDTTVLHADLEIERVVSVEPDTVEERLRKIWGPRLNESGINVSHNGSLGSSFRGHRRRRPTARDLLTQKGKAPRT